MHPHAAVQIRRTFSCPAMPEALFPPLWNRRRGK